MSDEGAVANVSLKVYEGTRLAATLPVWRTTELGRREPSEQPPYARLKRTDRDRIIVAELTETSISRKHLTVELVGEQSVRLTNESAKNSVVPPWPLSHVDRFDSRRFFHFTILSHGSAKWAWVAAAVTVQLAGWTPATPAGSTRECSGPRRISPGGPH